MILLQLLALFAFGFALGRISVPQFEIRKQREIEEQRTRKGA